MTPENKKVAIGVGVVGLAVGIYFLVQPKVDKSFNEDPTGNAGIPGQAPIAFSASIIAEKLYDAMKDMGTDELAIMNALKSVTPSQFIEVWNKFGKRSYNTTMGNQRNYLPFVTTLPLHNLGVWLKNELSASDYETLRLKYQSTNLL